MADLRARIGIKIVDPTTDANEVGVDASGNLQTILAANSGVDIGDVDVLTLPDVTLAAGTNNIGDVDVLSVIPGTGATNLGKIEDVAHSTGDVGVFMLSVRDDTPPTSTAGLTGEYAALLTDASGRLYVNLVDGGDVSLAAGTNNIGDVDVLSLPALPAGSNNIGDVDVLTLPNQEDDDDIVAAAQTQQRVLGLSYGFDGTQWERLTTDASGSLDVNLTLALPAGTNNIGDVDVLTLPDVNLAAGTNNIGDVDVLSGPTGSSAFETQGTAADGANPVGNPVLIAGFDGTNVQQLATDTAGNLQVDILTGGGADSPTDAKVDTVTSAALAAGSAVSLDGTQVASGLTGKLASITASASVPLKIEVRTSLNASYTTRIVLFSRSNEPVTWTAPHRNYISQVENVGGGFDGFNVNITNMDNSQAADVYATLFWDEQ